MNPPDDGGRRFQASLPGQLTADGQAVFSAPWQAQAFAMTVALYNGGLFTWQEWATALSGELAKRAAVDVEDTIDGYFEAWLSALENLVGSRTAADPALLLQLKSRWEAAYRATPHGQAVTLQQQNPFGL